MLGNDRGSMTLLLMTGEGIYAARDRYGRTPLVIGKKEDACCASFESHAYINLGYEDLKELGPGEIDFITPEASRFCRSQETRCESVLSSGYIMDIQPPLMRG